MSGKLSGQVWELKLPPAKRDILLALADTANDDGTDTHPGVPKLAWKLDISERQVQRLLRELEREGLLIVTERPARKPTVYQINLSKGVKKSPFVAQKKGVKKSGEELSPVNMSPDKLSPQTDSGVTSHEKDISTMGDTPSANLPGYVHKENTSLEDKAAALEPTIAKPIDEPLPEPPRIYAVYVENIRQQLTPIIADKLKDYVKEVGEQWVEDAIVEAVTHNAANWAYIEKVLQTWIKQGRGTPRPSTVSGAGLKPAPSQQQPLKPGLNKLTDPNAGGLEGDYYDRLYHRGRYARNAG